MTTITDFLYDYNIGAAMIDAEAVLEAFLSEMENGLKGKNSSLAMIPTFITVGRPLPPGKPAIVIDAGGTNLRICTVSFDDHGRPAIDNFSTYKMPGIDHELSRAEFYGKFVEYLAPVIDLSDQIGFCFSYPAEISPARDGKLIKWTKEVKAPEVVGDYIGASLLEALGDKGRGKEITILNDTIACLLAGRSAGVLDDYGSYIGFILGTGTNTAYVEDNSNITKLNGAIGPGCQAINVESGNFAKAPRGPVDVALDATTSDPGAYTFEKMISGRYQNELSLGTLKQAAQEGVFSESCAAWIRDLQQFTTRDVDDFLKGVNEGPLVSEAADESDAAKMIALFSAIYDRAAKLTAINISAAVLKSGAGKDPSRPVCINIDGSTYYKAYRFRERAEANLSQILAPRGIAYELVHADEAPVVGAAIAGLTH